MSPTGAIEWLLCLTVAIAAAALLSPIVINASMLDAGPRKASRVRTAKMFATLAAAIAAVLCLVRAAAGWPDGPLIWTVFAAFAAGWACLIASGLKDEEAQDRLVLSSRMLTAVGAFLYLLSDPGFHSPLGYGAVGLIVATALELVAYWRASRKRQERELQT